MCDEKHEQRINVKFLVKLKKTPTECYKLLKEAYGENSLSRARVFEWYKRFSEGRESTEDDQRPGRPVSVSTPQTVTKINEIVREDRHMSIRLIAETVNADKETVRKILLKAIGMIQKQGNWVSYKLKPRDVERHKMTCEIRFLFDEKIFTVDAKINRRNDRWLAYNPEDVPVVAKKFLVNIHVLGVVSSEDDRVVERVTNKSRHLNVMSLRTVIVAAFVGMDSATLQRACERFRSRIETVIQANGGHIE
ncbi:MOS1T transposase, partial [Acromyrmex charruanus]